MGKSAHSAEKIGHFQTVLAGTIVAKNVPEARASFIEAVSLSGARVLIAGGPGLPKNHHRQETVMKSVALFAVVLGALIIGSMSWETEASNTVRKQSAVTHFDRAVVVQGVTLKGEYLFVHDDAAMQRGEACTYIYEGKAPVHGKLVVSFHCVPTKRMKTEHFIFRSVETSPGIIELQEYQFSGDTEGHAVPTSIDQHVNVK